MLSVRAPSQHSQTWCDPPADSWLMQRSLQERSAMHDCFAN
jgi:hypothetical protein